MISATKPSVTQLIIVLTDILSIIQTEAVRRILVIMHNQTFISLLGRQPELSLAELEQVFGAVSPIDTIAATFESPDLPDIQRLGGATKLGTVVAEFEVEDWVRLSRRIVQYYTDRLRNFDGKVTIGISIYGHDIHPRDVQRTGIALKSSLKKNGVSMRLIPNDGPALSTATSHHNKLGLSSNKIELLIVYGKKIVTIAESLGTQNITALAARDQARPKTDAFVGMLPPKLALMMINLSGVTKGRNSKEMDSGDTVGHSSIPLILDPFCGTGVVLQESALLGFKSYGTDLSEKMNDYTTANMKWLDEKYRVPDFTVATGDAVEYTWDAPIDAVVAETYLGQPFSAPPAPDKLDKVRRVVDGIVDGFLKNIHSQIKPGTPLCLAVPAWRDTSGRFTHLPVVLHLEALGYEFQELTTTDVKRLIYYREDQVVARQLLILRRK